MRRTGGPGYTPRPSTEGVLVFLRRSSFIFAVTCTIVMAFASIAFADPGDVDASFGSLGHAILDLPGFDQVGAMDRQSTGKIVVAGDPNANSVHVFRLLPAGGLDAGFGVGGSRTLTVPGVTEFTASDLAIQSNDRIVVTGWADVATGNSPFVVARFLAGGAPDTSFGNGGIKKVGFAQGPAQSYGVAVQPSGRIVVVGEVDPSPAVTRFAALRLRANGSLDTTFGIGGRKVIPLPDSFAGEDAAWRVRAMGDGRLVLAGWNEVASGLRTVVVRLLTSGKLDLTLSGDGVAIVDVRPHAADWAEGLELAGTKIVLGVAGLSGEAAVVRLRPGGARDDTFSGDGIAKLAQPSFIVTDVAVQTNGKILVGSSDGALLRLSAGGVRDLGFGTNGATEDPAISGGGSAIELQGGKILLAGDDAGVSYVSRFLG